VVAGLRGLNEARLAQECSEPPRDCRRPQRLRGWGHEHIKAILPGGAGEGGSDGAGACCGPRVAMGGDPFDLGEDRMHGRESAPVGATG